jgi:hypothetical protein
VCEARPQHREELLLHSRARLCPLLNMSAPAARVGRHGLAAAAREIRTAQTANLHGRQRLRRRWRRAINTRSCGVIILIVDHAKTDELIRLFLFIDERGNVPCRLQVPSLGDRPPPPPPVLSHQLGPFSMVSSDPASNQLFRAPGEANVDIVRMCWGEAQIPFVKPIVWAEGWCQPAALGDCHRLSRNDSIVTYIVD